MHVRRGPVLALAILLAAVGGCQEPQDPNDPEPEAIESPPDRLPADWDLADIGRAAFRDEERESGVRVRPDLVQVLAWEAQEDDRPWYFEGCVVWARWAERGVPRWRLAHLYRNPRVGETSWQPHWTDHGPRHSVRTFDRPPANAEVYRFLADNGWDFRPARPSFEIRDAGVCVRAWREAIGQDPDGFYDPKDIKPRRAGSAIGPPPREVGSPRP